MRTFPCLLLTVTLLLLTSCASWPRAKPASEPPRIDCSARTPIEPLPHYPNLAALPEAVQTDDWWRAYVRRLTAVLGAYERRLMGVIESEVVKRGEVAGCLDRERAAGRIR